MFRKAKIILIGLLFSTAVWADDDDWDDRGGYGYGYPYYQQEIIYAPPVVQYVEPPIVEYAAPPVVEYVPLQPRYHAPPPPVSHYTYDRRSPHGLLGGMVGSAMGYELGAGDPLVAGLGAAAGAWFGNGGY